MTTIGIGADTPWAKMSSPPRPLSLTDFTVVPLNSGALQTARVGSPGTDWQSVPTVSGAAVSNTTRGSVAVPARDRTTWSLALVPVKRIPSVAVEVTLAGGSTAPAGIAVVSEAMAPPAMARRATRRMELGRWNIGVLLPI